MEATKKRGRPALRPQLEHEKQRRQAADRALQDSKEILKAVLDGPLAVTMASGKPTTALCQACELNGRHDLATGRVLRCDCPCHKARAFLGDDRHVEV